MDTTQTSDITLRTPEGTYTAVLGSREWHTDEDTGEEFSVRGVTVTRPDGLTFGYFARDIDDARRMLREMVG